MNDMMLDYVYERFCKNVRCEELKVQNEKGVKAKGAGHPYCNSNECRLHKLTQPCPTWRE